MYLKFVNRVALIPTSETFMVQCGSFRAEKSVVLAGKPIDEEKSSLVYWPFHEGDRQVAEEDTILLTVHVYGAPGFEWVAATDVIMFVMNDQGETVDRITI